jgi:hypothetical protein
MMVVISQLIGCQITVIMARAAVPLGPGGQPSHSTGFPGAGEGVRDS